MQYHAVTGDVEEVLLTVLHAFTQFAGMIYCRIVFLWVDRTERGTLEHAAPVWNVALSLPLTIFCPVPITSIRCEEVEEYFRITLKKFRDPVMKKLVFG